MVACMACVEREQDDSNLASFTCLHILYIYKHTVVIHIGLHVSLFGCAIQCIVIVACTEEGIP